MKPETIVAALLALATLGAAIRLLLWQRSAAQRAHPWRLALLLTLQPVTAILLYCALFPPASIGQTASLRIATAGAPRLASAGGDPLILLPEAPSIAGGERAPDLATALRRYPGVRTIRVLGNGLKPRDVDQARGLSVQFNAGAFPTGLTHLAPPPAIAPGSRFEVGGTVAGMPDADVELLDPAGRVTDAQPVREDGGFLLAGTARAAGTARFTLRILRGKRVIEKATVPLWVEETPRPRLLILSGAPGPEAKYLRRWAEDAGFDVVAQMAAGGGISLGDAPVPLDAASLARFDAAIVDDRSWPAARNALASAAASGLGLILRASGPLDAATRAQWRALGFALGGTNRVVPLALPPVHPPAIATTRQGIGDEGSPPDIASPDDPLPDINRVDLAPEGAGVVPILRDAGGRTLAGWRAIGRGRVALFTGTDSYGLTLTGRRDLHGDWWSALLSAVARPAPTGIVDTALHWAGERTTLCGLTGPARLEGPDGRRTQLAPVNGCAAFWPEKAGWFRVRDGKSWRAAYVHDRGALPALRQARDRQATALLASSQRDRPAAAAAPSVPPWLWWLGWLMAVALLWWLERSRFGRNQDARSTM
ncbi:hypothetical protein SAMIE_1008380 [Sphingobium amiense]|uniref:Carboxypeptidase regulatory-like domain-containing protein n=1 Tax=Sphingobium amiense TaxID=135719 RepID=A0A494W415_9SPHN|nr:hypothetical protein [Sphingobium amiense]BBD97337.1 hypothetical protein SAMIE_1008380 [Sphingobium amiense]